MDDLCPQLRKKTLYVSLYAKSFERLVIPLDQGGYRSTLDAICHCANDTREFSAFLNLEHFPFSHGHIRQQKSSWRIQSM